MYCFLQVFIGIEVVVISKPLSLQEVVSSLQTIHNRSPLLQKIKEKYGRLIYRRRNLPRFLGYEYDNIEFYKVDRAVNNPKNNNDFL